MLRAVRRYLGLSGREGGMIMLELLALLAFIFVIGVLVGVRCQEINLSHRERRLADERRRVNEKICSGQTNSPRPTRCSPLSGCSRSGKPTPEGPVPPTP